MEKDQGVMSSLNKRRKEVQVIVFRNVGKGLSLTMNKEKSLISKSIKNWISESELNFFSFLEKSLNFQNYYVYYYAELDAL